MLIYSLVSETHLAISHITKIKTSLKRKGKRIGAK